MINQLILTTAQREQLVQALTTPHGYAQAAIDMLEDLPVVDSEPVAWMNSDDLCADTAFRWVRLDEFISPVFASPQALTDRDIAEKCAEICRSRSRSISADGHNVMAANEASKCALAIESHWQTYPSKALTPITADDVTEMMVLTHNATTVRHSDHNYKIVIASAYNAVIKHRSEAK